jgi:hypothetical protein
MPAEHSLDHAIRCIGFSPFKCRACRAKFYRRSNTILEGPNATRSGHAERACEPGICQRDPASTMRRVEQIILVAEVARVSEGGRTRTPQPGLEQLAAIESRTLEVPAAQDVGRLGLIKSGRGASNVGDSRIGSPNLASACPGNNSRNTLRGSFITFLQARIMASST